MSASPSLLDLPAEDQAEFIGLLRQKLNAAQEELSTVDKQIEELVARKNAVTDKVKRYQLFMSFSISDMPVVAAIASEPAQRVSYTNTFQLPEHKVVSSYEEAGSQYEKLLYIISRPEKYGQRSFVGAKPVIDAMRQEDADVRDEAEDSIRKRVGPALSRMAKDGLLIKMAERRNLVRVHYLSLTWFENGELKPQYKELLRSYELVPIAPRTANNNQELPLTLSQPNTTETQIEDNEQQKTAPVEAEAESEIRDLVLTGLDRSTDSNSMSEN